MAMQQNGKGDASGSGANPSLSADQAEEHAASFRPAWDVDTDNDETAIEPPPAALADYPVRVGKATLLGTGMPDAAARGAISSSELIAAEAILEAAPAPPKSKPAPVAQAKGPSKPPPAPRARPAAKGAAPARGAMKSRPGGRAADAKPATISDEFAAIVPKKSKGYLYVFVGLGIAAGVAILVRFYLADEGPQPAPAQAAGQIAPPPTTAEIPPPPPKQDPPPARTDAPKAQVATPTTPTTPLATNPPPAAKAPEPPRPAAMAPAAAPKPRALPAQPAAPAQAAPKTAPKPAGGAIVRDNPF